MKNIKNALIVILIVALITSVAFNIISVTNTRTTSDHQKDAYTSYLEKIDHKINSGDYTITTDDYDDLKQYQDLNAQQLAVLVSNGDYPVEIMDIVAKNHGYKGYTDMCNQLINAELLVYIPEYVHPEYGVMEEDITTPSTVAYALAVEAGVIKN